MAVIKFTNSKSSIKNILAYITQASKTETRLITGKDCMPETALDEMELIKDIYRKRNGRQYIHIVQSFDPNDQLSYEKANKIGVLLAEYFVGFQAVVATHQDRQHVHNHILLNSVNFETGLKFQQSQKDMQEVKNFSDKLCLENGLSIIEKSLNMFNINKNEYQSAIKGNSWKFKLMNAIDTAIEKSSSRQSFIKNMEEQGYNVCWTDRRKYITYTTPEGQKCRDNKLHDSKYLKSSMETVFEKIHLPKNNNKNLENLTETNMEGALSSALQLFGGTTHKPRSRSRTGRSEMSKQAKKEYAMKQESTSLNWNEENEWER